MLKNCTVCKRQYTNDWLRAHAGVYLRTPHGGVVSEMGLIMFNCTCGTTLGVRTEELYPELTDELKDLYKHTPRYCVAWIVLAKRLEVNLELKEEK